MESRAEEQVDNLKYLNKIKAPKNQISTLNQLHSKSTNQNTSTDANM